MQPVVFHRLQKFGRFFKNNRSLVFIKTSSLPLTYNICVIIGDVAKLVVFKTSAAKFKCN